jgi:hypothetical protein
MHCLTLVRANYTYSVPLFLGRPHPLKDVLLPTRNPDAPKESQAFEPSESQAYSGTTDTKTLKAQRWVGNSESTVVRLLNELPENLCSPPAVTLLEMYPPLERVDQLYGRKIVVLPAVERLPAPSIATTVTTLSPGTPYALGVMFVPMAVFSCRPFT